MISNLEMWGLIVGVLMPFVVALVQRPGWSDQMRAVVTIVACVIAGAITTYIEADLEATRQLVTTILTVIVAAIATYNGFWKKTELRLFQYDRPRAEGGWSVVEVLLVIVLAGIAILVLRAIL